MMTTLIDNDSELESGKLWSTPDEAERRLELHLHRLRADGWTVVDNGASYRITRAGEKERVVGITRYYAIVEQVVRS